MPKGPSAEGPSGRARLVENLAGWPREVFVGVEEVLHIPHRNLPLFGHLEEYSGLLSPFLGERGAVGVPTALVAYPLEP